MDTKPKYLVCKHCGNIVEMMHDAGVKVICCGDPMEDLTANTTDGAQEKHVPAYTVDGESSTTEALLGTCFRQIEYAGILKGAANEVGARKFIDFMLSPEVQSAIPENLYMYPAVIDTELPEDWARFAPLASSPIEVPAEEIGANRDRWIQEWTEAIG